MHDRRFQVVLFDLDGTLTASEDLALEQFKDVLPRFIHRPITDSEARALIGRPISVSLPSVFPELAPVADKIIGTILEGWWEINHRVRAYPNVQPLLRSLREQEYAIGIVTSKRKAFVPTELRVSGLAEFIATIVDFDDCPPGKHKPDPFSLYSAAQRLGVSSNACVYVGDQPNDILAAHAAKMPALAAVWGCGSRGQLEQYEPTFYANEPKDVLRFLSTAMPP